MTLPLWTPSDDRKANSQMAAFMGVVRERFGLPISGDDYDALHRFSITRQEDFWNAAWDFCGVKASVRGERVC
jgi:hypothetical protein